MPQRNARLVLVVLAMLAIAAQAHAAAPASSAPSDDPFSMVRERLTVTGPNRRPQPLSEVPSAVSVITAAEIHAHGYRTLGEVLQWVRGLYTRYDRNYTYLGVRGLQRPGDYNNKVLLTIDGHTVNAPIYGDAAFGSELGLDLERVERVEVVRGPGSSVYGSNAVLAVVNVVTRGPRSSPGIEASVRSGGPGARRVFASVASSRSGRPQFALSISADDIDGADHTYPEFAPVLGNGGRVTGADGERSRSIFGSLAWRGLRLTTKVNERRKHVPTGSYSTVPGSTATLTSDGHDYVELATTRGLGPAVELSSRAYWDGSRYWGDYSYDASPGTYIERDLGYSDLFGAESHAYWRPGTGHVVTVGAEVRAVTRALQYVVDLAPGVVHTRADNRSRQFGAFLQDEWAAARGARVTAGVRLDAYDRYGSVASPRLDLVVPCGTNTVLKLTGGSAFRSPVPYETAYTSDDLLPNPDLLPERVVTAEAGLVRRYGRASLTLSAYRNSVRDLAEPAEVDSLGNYRYFNLGRVRGSGGEAELEWIASGGTRARADLSCQRSTDVSTGAELSNSPRWNAHLVLTHPRLAGPVFGGLGARWMSSRTTFRGTLLPSFEVVDARLGVSGPRGLEAAIEARNLFDVDWADPAGSEHVQDAIAQDGRCVFVTLRWRLTRR